MNGVPAAERSGAIDDRLDGVKQRVHQE
jgi:hypothetical protein